MSQKDKKGHGRQIAILGGSLLLTVLTLAAVLYFWDRIQGAVGYGYAGCFLATGVAGMTVWPGPGLLVVFTLGHKLNPLYAGLAGGLGEALGSLVIYATGASGGSVWDGLIRKIRHSGNVPEARISAPQPDNPKPKSWWAAFIERLSAPVQRWGGGWPVFITSAVIFSPFYLVALGAGAARTGLKKFFLISWAGKTIKCLYIALAGYWGLYFIVKWLGG